MQWHNTIVQIVLYFEERISQRETKFRQRQNLELLLSTVNNDVVDRNTLFSLINYAIRDATSF